jgi:protease-4
MLISMSMPRLSALLALTGASLALAQTAEVSTTDLSRGTTLPPASTAFSDDATSLVFNPAALSRVGRFSAVYAHERSNTRSQNNDGLWLATSFSELVGLGFSWESLRPSAQDARTRTTLGLSVGPQPLSFGANVGFLGGGAVNGLAVLDLGLQSRPTRWLAFGAFARNVNAPGPLAREYLVGVGLRPFGERLSLGLDWVVPEQLSPDHSRLQYTVQAEVLHGLKVSLGLSHAFSSAQPLTFQAGLSVDLEHVGYTQGVAVAQGQVNWQYVARYSLEPQRSVVPQHKLAVVSLGDIGASGGSTLGSLLGLAAEDRYLRFLRYLERAAQDPELSGVVLKIEGSSLGLARADEVRTAVLKLRAAGKKVFAYELSVGDAEYLIASACDDISSAPEAMLMVDGLKSTVTFLGGTAKMLGIDVDVARVGAYKNFPDQFTRADMSPEQQEALTAYLDTSVKAVQERVLAQRHFTPASWQADVDEGLKPVSRAKELGEIDAVLTPHEFEQKLLAALPGVTVAKPYHPLEGEPVRWGPGRKIAIIPVLGSITGGKNSSSPVGGEIAGAESFITAVDEAAADPDVLAIVVRVDSGGGDGMASDLMYRAVLEAKKKKPVVASMGDVAASGGYYVAMGADQIVASPTTLTGSIGVFFAKPAVARAAHGLGVNQQSLSRGHLAGITDVFEPWSDDQRAAAQKWVDAFYDTFITEVAASRKLDKAKVDAVARGRVWSGQDALARGLVDHLGGLLDAVAAARTRAGLKASDDDVELVVWQSKSGLLGSLLGASALSPLLETAVPQAGLPAPLDTLARKFGPAAWLFEPPRVQARLEFGLEVE